jgi:hypothetical protein
MDRVPSFFKKWVNSLYLVAFAFIAVGVILFFIPTLKGTLWLTIDGALVGAGFTILVTTITSQRSISEQYKKEANLQRKTDVYGPLHAELKVLRETFDDVRAGGAPYPQYIGIHSDSFHPSLVLTTYTPYTFAWWPTFKENYHIDDFTSAAQKRLNDLQSHAEVYNTAVETTRKAVQAILMRRIATSIEKEEQRSSYQEWLHASNSGSYTDEKRWFDFIKMERTVVSPDMPLGKGLSRSWAHKVEWLLADKADQAAQEVYDTDARQWGAPNAVELSWFKDIFDATLTELRNDPAYKQVIHAQEELFKRLQDAEKMLEEGLRYIRDRYEGGTPPV